MKYPGNINIGKVIIRLSRDIGKKNKQYRENGLRPIHSGLVSPAFLFVAFSFIFIQDAILKISHHERQPLP